MKEPSRYIRQENLESFGLINQRKLLKSNVLIVGLGGLGIPVAQYLNAMGVGSIGLVENDVVELHNLQRQVLYSEADVGKTKLKVCLANLQEQNSTTKISSFATFLTRDNALDIVKDFDIVVDATDNFETRYLINDVCVILNKPFVYGALHAFEGQVSVFNYNNGPTYRCLFPDMPKNYEILNCDENGVLGVLPGIIGTLQALEVVKLITGVGEVLSGKLMLFNGLTQTTQKIGFKLRPENQEIKKLQKDYHSLGCSVENILSSEVFETIYLREDIQIVDVRSPDEFADHHLEKAINIPLSDLTANIEKIDFAQSVYLICQSGVRSEKALESLRKTYSKTAIYSISGGMNKLQSLCH